MFDVVALMSSSALATSYCVIVARPFNVDSCGATIGFLDVGSYVTTPILDVTRLLYYLEKLLVLLVAWINTKVLGWT